VRRVAASLKIQPVPEADLLRPRVLASAAGDVVRTSEKLKVNNSAFRREYVLGADTPELRAATPALASFVSEPFYSELRTRQQLGYIVGGGAAEDRRSEFAYFIVQSGEYPADVLEARADAFIRTLPDKLAALPDASWKSIVAGVRAKLEEKDKSIAERAGRLFELAYERNADWGRRQATLAALDKLTQARAAEILRQALSPETGRVRTFLGFAREHEPKREPVVTFTDTAAWKARQRFE
jgi:secreted Zn-dependent insulinase-like peptidase